MNRQAIGWSCAAAAIIGALFTLASWATGATLMFLAPLVGCAAGVGYVAGLRGTATRVPAMMHGIAAAGITLVAILAGRVTLGWIDVRAWNERMSEVTGDDLHGVIAERIAARAIDAGEIDVDAEEYPDWVSDEADEELAAMSGEEVERLRAELQADGEEAAEELSAAIRDAVDLDGALEGPALDRDGDVVEGHLELVGEDAQHRRPHHVEGEVEEHEWQLVHGATEADDLAHDVGLVVQRVVEELLHPDLADAGADAADEAGEDVERPPRVDAGDEDRAVALRTRRLDHVE